MKSVALVSNFIILILLNFFSDFYYGYFIPSARIGRCRVTLTMKGSVAVVGAGWAGWGAAKSLCQAGFNVTLIDAVPDPAGLEISRIPSGKPFDPGHKGFWIDYPNINDLLKELSIKEDDVFTPFTNSSFYSPFGLEATAPVFSASNFPTLPSPLGQVLATFPLFERLPLEDRASIIGLLFAILDMDKDERTFAAYDRMTAHDLFIRMGISKRLVDDFIRPTLLVGLFKPPEELSAALVMELLYYYALAHQSSFDVRWLKTGTIANTFFAPLYRKLQSEFNLKLLSNSRVVSLQLNKSTKEGNPPTVTAVKYSQFNKATGKTTINELAVDAVVLALGAKGLSAVMKGSPELSRSSPQLSKAATLGSIDCIACRLWLDKTHATNSPSNVFSRFDALRGAGGTFFMLDQLHKDHLNELWGEEDASVAQREHVGRNISKGSVIAVDFYNAGALLPLSDEDLLDTISMDLLPKAIRTFYVDKSNTSYSQTGATKVLDFAVQRFPGAVTWFSPGSYEKRPRTVVEGVRNLFCAGDWVVVASSVDSTAISPFSLDALSVKDGFSKWIRARLSPVKRSSSVDFKVEEHGAKGLCQERAYVSGIFAANKLIDRLKPESPKAKIIPVRDDEPQVRFGRKINKRISKMFNPLNLDSPWLR